MSKLFSKLIQSINDFVPDDPFQLEVELEKSLETHLLKDGFALSRQKSVKGDRYDLVCRSGNEVVCLEIKLRADISDIKQFDKYLPKFKDGFIVVCWQSSFSVRNIFQQVIDQSPIPTTLIELSKRYNLV